MSVNDAEVFKATEAIRRILEWYPVGKPNTAARQEAEKEIQIIRDNSPKDCEGALHSLLKWLDTLFNETEEGLERIYIVRGYIRSDLDKIEAIVNKGGE